MIRSFVTILLRQFSRNLSYSVISVSGLVISLTMSILIFLWVAYELRYDHQYPDNNRVFWVLTNETYDGVIETTDDTPVGLADFIRAEVPEAEAIARMDYTGADFSYQTKTTNQVGYAADPDILKVFHFDLLKGNPEKLLPDLTSIVISEKLAHILFENGDALGKTVTRNLNQPFKVTGVFASFPVNSSLNNTDFIIPFLSRPRDPINDWQPTMIKLVPNASAGAVKAKIDDIFKRSFKFEGKSAILFCLTDWRLYWSFENGKQTGGRIVYVIIFSISAVFILLMACINYMNLSTARATMRAREIGVRKMTGATRSSLTYQFLFESLATTSIAALLALGLAYLLLPSIREFTSVNKTFSLGDPVLITGLVTITLFTGVLAGSYPAWMLGSFKPATVLKGDVNSMFTGVGLRKGLVVFQFTLSIILIVSSVIIVKQIDFLLKKDLGFDRNNVVYVEVPEGLTKNLESFKAETLTHPSVVSAGIGAASPMETNGTSQTTRPGLGDQYKLMFRGASIDATYLPTLGFEFTQGRNFDANYALDSANYIITQKAADLLGLKEPIGQTISYDMFGYRVGKVIGVIKDFHNEDIHAPIDPVVFFYGNTKIYEEGARVFVRYEQGKLEDALAHLKNVYGKFLPGISMQYGFLDQDFDYQFFAEKLMRRIMVCFTVIAITIALLGLFGLTLFSTQRRTKEIGVRKVLGATVSQIVVLLCRDYTRPVLMSFVLGFPLAYYLMEKFLQGYLYRTTITGAVFLMVALCLTCMVLLTVAYQSVRAAIKNPTEALKAE